jgi:hypothetical protein
MKIRNTTRGLVVALVLCAGVAMAQDQKQDTPPVDRNAPLQPLDTAPSGRPPIGAARGVSSPLDEQPYDPSQVVPDRNTLAGTAPITLGSLQHTRNTLDPAISFSQLGQTFPGVAGKSVLVGNSIISGSLNFNRTWSQYQFTALYDGGETFNIGYGGLGSVTGVNAPHYPFHYLMATQAINWARWHLILSDNFSSSPGATFTGQGVGGPGLTAENLNLLGTIVSGLGQTFVQTINTGDGQRYQNSVLGQAEYSFSRRSAVTFSGSYGVLHFTDAGYVNSTMANGQIGYDYMLSPADSIAILASYGNINYSGSAVSTTNYIAALAYGRRITGRLAFQISAGPEEIQNKSTSITGNSRLWIASVNSALSYQRRRTGLSLNYLHGLTAGSGVFIGAVSNAFVASAHYQFTRSWTGTINGGYSLNKSLASAGFPETRFDNWLIGWNLGRRVGPHAQLNFNYGLTKQNSPTPCPVPSCGITGLQQSFGMSVNWHLRPNG